MPSKKSQQMPPTGMGEAPIDAGGGMGMEPMGAPDMDMDMGPEIGVDPDMAGDDRPLSDAVSELAELAQEVKQKVDSGEAVVDGQDVEPIADTGANAAPSPKVALDKPAEDYWVSYFKEYGQDMVDARNLRHEAVTDLIDSTATEYGIKLSNKQLVDITNYVLSIDASTNDSARYAVAMYASAPLADVLDKTLVKYMADRSFSVIDINKGAVLAAAVRSVPFNTRMDRYITKVAEGIKKPKLNKSHDDAVKLDKMEDWAKDKDKMLARPAHVKFNHSNVRLSGVYIKMDVSWDSDSPAAKMTPDGMTQAIKSYIKGLESTKEFMDYGFMGQINVSDLDMDAGIASVHFRAKKPADAPVLYKEDEDE